MPVPQLPTDVYSNASVAVAVYPEPLECELIAVDVLHPPTQRSTTILIIPIGFVKPITEVCEQVVVVPLREADNLVGVAVHAVAVEPRYPVQIAADTGVALERTALQLPRLIAVKAVVRRLPPTETVGKPPVLIREQHHYRGCRQVDQVH